MTLYEQAQQKVRNSQELSEHEDFILADWGEGEEHLEWVIEADEEEIISWVKAGQ